MHEFALHSSCCYSVDESVDLEEYKPFQAVKSFPSEIIRTYHLDDVETRSGHVFIFCHFYYLHTELLSLLPMSSVRWELFIDLRSTSF